MATITAEQARDLADVFLSLSRATMQYRLARENELTDEQEQQLKNTEIDLRDRSQDLAGLAGRLTLDDLDCALSRVSAATSDMQNAIHNLQTVTKVIVVATAAVKLGGAMVAGNPMAILGAAKEAAAAVA